MITMDAIIEKLIEELPSAVAIIVVIVLFLRSIEKRDRLFADALRDQGNIFARAISKQGTQFVRSLNKNSKKIEEFEDALLDFLNTAKEAMNIKTSNSDKRRKQT